MKTISCFLDRSACRVFAMLAVLIFALAPPLLQAGVKAYRGQITLPTYPWWPAVKHPYFRGTDGKNIYPYPMLDNISRHKGSRTYQTVILENEYLRVTFLPELGGKIYDVFDKTAAKPMFYVNRVVKPGLIAQCGAWTSGGVEWNTGPQGHTVGCMQAVDVEILPSAPDGSRSVAVGETERIYRTHWTVIVTLRPGRSFLEETIRIYNGTETVRPYYFWNCTAEPNTPGFRFVYPMTLGMDHSGAQFFSWPVHEGRDLTRGTNYQDASSIFAYHCDQDFFGSYDDGADRGVVSYANHHQLPGKKAWTWGQGGFGTMHQMDLTDDDGPYNEVQTGPLLTQGEVGRLEPHEAVSWQEWWYPVRGIGGFTFANHDVAVNASVADDTVQLRLIGTGSWPTATVEALKGGRTLASAKVKISPREPTEVKLRVAGSKQGLQIAIRSPRETLAAFSVPLDLPKREPPAKREPPKTGSELAQAGWQDFLFARFPEAETQFRKALERDPALVAAHVGLAYLNLDRDPAAAAKEANAALAVDPDLGPARLALAVANLQMNAATPALDEAWKAALDPATAVAGRGLAAKILLRQHNWEAAGNALSEPGPWQSDAICRNRLAFAWHQLGNRKAAAKLAEQNLGEDPLDAFARSVLWLSGVESKDFPLASLVNGREEPVLDLVAAYCELEANEIALRILNQFYIEPVSDKSPIPCYWGAYLLHRREDREGADKLLRLARTRPTDLVFPHRAETVPVLRWACEMDPSDGKAALYLGHVLFHLGRHGEGRELWAKAAKLGAAPSVALRGLGLASLTLDNDAHAADKFLTQAHELDRADAIIARDLARVLFTRADKPGSATNTNEFIVRARDTLKAAFAAGQGRSDFVSLLGKAHNRLNEYDQTAKLLDVVRVTIWEGGREVHDLFEEAHLALGKAHLEAGRAAQALAEFNRALEYPANLATGKLDNTREAHLHYLRGNAFAALGQKQAALETWKKAADEPASDDPKKEKARRKAKEALGKAAQL